MSIANRFLALAAISYAILVALLVLTLVCAGLYSARAHDMQHPELDGWYKSLMQPDNPTIPCCGEADAYWCDDIHVRDGETYCSITDDRPDEPLHRIPRKIGDEFLIPDRKLKWDRGNPVGHSIVFLSAGGAVYCFVQDGGS
ncbi:MAG TPA: hypothetical protein VN815_13245 [Steroidobacteraceae bacterium]|nr:hypothetical protein [Steroidobacteraceae bacterium]